MADTTPNGPQGAGAVGVSCVEVGGQRILISSLHLRWSQGSHLGHQPWEHVPLLLGRLDGPTNGL
uniref:Transmembrane protein 33 n=1 Tax=Mus musculus TaxID=10090 RepID=E0CYW6_MOUSE